MVKNPPGSAGDARHAGSILGSGRSPGEGHSNPLQYSCLESAMDRGAWWAIVHTFTEFDTTEILSTHNCESTNFSSLMPPVCGNLLWQL